MTSPSAHTLFSMVRELGLSHDDIPNAPLGKTFSKLYDLDRVKPLDFYVDMYRKKKAEIQKLGVDYSVL